MDQQKNSGQPLAFDVTMPTDALTPASPPTLLIVPARDRLVPPSGADGFVDAARAAGVPVERVLLRFDGDQKLGSMDYYYKQPWLTDDAAHWLVDQGCKLVGMDTPMPDGPENTKTMPVHKILLGAGVVIVEYMVNLAAIQADTFDLIVAPLKIKEGDGAPARCFAIVND